jgi:3-hydroxybutyryl-CoA dehydrogenase
MGRDVEINNVAVLGAGMIGHGIALSFAKAGYHVALVDTSDELVQKGLDWIKADLEYLLANELISKAEADDIPDKIKVFADLENAVGSADFITEAISEDLGLKQKLFNKLDRLCSKEVVFTTTTSSLRVSDIAQKTVHKQRIIGTHWVNPPHIMPLVEVASADDTSQQTVEITLDLLKKIGKVPVRCKDNPGFINNRLLYAMMNEGLKLIETGVASAEDVDNTIRYGFGPRVVLYGPFRWLDMFAHPKHNLNIYSILYEQTKDEKFKPSVLFEEKLQSGEIGFASGKGWYEYPGESPEFLDSKRREMLAQIALWFKSQGLI